MSKILRIMLDASTVLALRRCVDHIKKGEGNKLVAFHVQTEPQTWIEAMDKIVSLMEHSLIKKKFKRGRRSKRS